MYLITKWFGTFIFDKTGLKKKILFSKNIKDISKILKKIDKSEILAEEKKISKNIEVIVNEKRLQIIGEYKPLDPFFKEVKLDPKDFDFSEEMLNKATSLIVKEKIKEQLKSEDLQIVHMVNALDDLIQTSNLLTERLENWNVIPNSKSKTKSLEKSLSTVKISIESLEHEIEQDMNRVAPNISDISGPLIGARLISLSGGLENLAFAPASTIQILGAEKALFRFKKEGGRPPKHGVIFQHHYINRAPRAVRGKIARVFANKISIAAKADAFTKRNISNELRKNLETRIKEIKNL
jgi:nucleolar protein 56